MLFSELNKVMPILKQFGFYVNWNGEEPWKTKFYTYKEFAEKYNFKKIQVIECKSHWNYSPEFDFELILKKI